jgi:hypothetical protein
MRPKTVGYVVTCRNAVMWLNSRDKRLYFGREGTLFKDRRRAIGAKRRTLLAALNEDRDWNAEFGPLHITRITEAT